MYINNKKIAVLLSSYNGERYIIPQIRSILDQDVEIPIQLFVRDDGSTDNTVQIVQELERKDERVTLIPSNNIGSVASFFALLKMAHDLPDCFDYFALSDQDDVWDSDKLKIAINAINSKNMETAILYGSTTRPVNQDLEPLKYRKSVLKPFDLYNTIIQIKIPGHTHVMNRSLLNLVYNADPSRIFGHDAFLVNAAKICGCLIFDKTAHASYRQHSGNQLGTSRNGRLKWIQNRLSRVRRGGGAQYARQIEYIMECFGDKMTSEQYYEIKDFLDSRSFFLKRLSYISRTKLYRQDSFDTFAFKLMYLFGGYNIK